MHFYVHYYYYGLEKEDISVGREDFKEKMGFELKL